MTVKVLLMGVKDRRTKILLVFFFLNDTAFNLIKFDERVQNIFDLTFNQKTKGTISGLLKENLIEKKEIIPPAENSSTIDNLSVKEYKLTEKGYDELCLKFPFLRFLLHKWDQKWRVISYEIPEKKRHLRDRLRREMAGWGLGPWHRSFWLTPHSIMQELQNLVSQKEEEQYIQAFEADHIFGDKNVLIEKVWGKSILEKKYRQLFKSWHDILSKEEDKITKFRKVLTEYLMILRDDPGLPSQLIGESWIGFEAFNIFKEIRNILLN